MSERFFKQIAFSFLTAAIVFFIGLITFQIVRPKPSCFDRIKNNNETGVDCGGKCQSCEIKTLTKLEYADEGYSFIQKDKYFVYTKVTNLNSDWGVKEFNYVFNFISTTTVKNKIQEKVEKKVVGKEYILPNQVKYIVEVMPIPNVKFDKIVFQVDEKNILWSKPLSVDFVSADLFGISNISLKTGSGQIVTSTTKAGNVVYSFKKDLKRGDKGEDVFNLQSILASNNAVYPEGVVNGTFDLPTYKAVIRFQKSIGISPQTGIVDYKTREYLNQSYGGQKANTISSGGFSFENNLKLNDSGSEVKELQRILAEDPAVYPEARLTGKFDLLLKKAVERFQAKYNLQVTGEFDTPTRTQLNNLLNKKTDDNQLSPGVTASLSFTIFNNANATFKNISLIGFLCDSDGKLVAISKSQSDILAQKSRDFVLSWSHVLPVGVDICPGGLNVYTNVFDEGNIQK